MAWVTMSEAARQLGVSVDTIERRRRNGILQGRQQSRPQGYVWLVELPDEPNDPGGNGASPPVDTPVDTQVSTGEVQALRELVTTLQVQVEADREELAAKNEQIRELHVLLQQQAQAALPVPRENRQSWWRFWER